MPYKVNADAWIPDAVTAAFNAQALELREGTDKSGNKTHYLTSGGGAIGGVAFNVPLPEDVAKKLTTLLGFDCSTAGVVSLNATLNIRRLGKPTGQKTAGEKKPAKGISMADFMAETEDL